MSRKERRKEPALTPKERVELSQKNIPLRIVLVVLALEDPIHINIERVDDTTRRITIEGVEV